MISKEYCISFFKYLYNLRKYYSAFQSGSSPFTKVPIKGFLIYQGLNYADVEIPCPEIIKPFSCPTQLSTKFILLLNVKMPTIVGILTLISITNSRSERLRARNMFICRYFGFYEQLKFRAQLS